jgi:hypothetical protein
MWIISIIENSAYLFIMRAFPNSRILTDMHNQITSEYKINLFHDNM